jgi:hypothetical protein
MCSICAVEVLAESSVSLNLSHLVVAFMGKYVKGGKVV